MKKKKKGIKKKKKGIRVLDCSLRSALLYSLEGNKGSYKLAPCWNQHVTLLSCVQAKSTLPKSLNCTVTFLKFKSKSGAMGDRLHESIPSVSQSTRSTLRALHWPRSTRFKAPAGSARAAKAHVAAWRSRGDTVSLMKYTKAFGTAYLQYHGQSRRRLL